MPFKIFSVTTSDGMRTDIFTGVTKEVEVMKGKRRLRRCQRCGFLFSRVRGMQLKMDAAGKYEIVKIVSMDCEKSASGKHVFYR